MRYSVEKPGWYRRLRWYWSERKSPTRTRAVLEMWCSRPTWARVPTVHRTTFSSGQVALYTNAAGVSGV